MTNPLKIKLPHLPFRDKPTKPIEGQSKESQGLGEPKPETPRGSEVVETKKPDGVGTETVQPKKMQARFYVYCVVPAAAPKNYGKIGINGDQLVYTIVHKDMAAVVSEFNGDKFEKNEENVLAHQRVVQKVFEKQMGVPIKFGTMEPSSIDVQRFLEEGYENFKKQLADLNPAKNETSEEFTGTTDVISQILEQSAASAVKIRGLTDALDTFKRSGYEKGADRLPEGAAKQLLEFLAKAPPGSYEASEMPTGAAAEQIQSIQRRLDTLFEDIGNLREILSTQYGSGAVAEIREEQDKIIEAVNSLRTIYNENVASVEKTIGKSLMEYFETVPSSMTTYLRKIAVETVEGMGKEASLTTPSQPSLPQPAVEVFPTYTRCFSCGAGIVITDRFCSHCGRPTAVQYAPGR